MAERGIKRVICVDDVVTESIQYYTIKTQFQMTTLTSLDDLKYVDSCDCRQITLESNLPCLELVFLIDGSDSFNSKFNDNGNGLFQLAVAWTNRFLKSCEYMNKDEAPIITTVIQFSGVGPLTKNYISGSGFGKVDASGKLSLVEGAKMGQASPDLSHWKVEMNPTDISEAAPSFKASPLDGNGQLYLCLQDLTIKNGPFQQLLDAKLAKTAGASKISGVTRALILLTDDQWDLGSLKEFDQISKTFKDAKKETIVKSTHDFFEKIYVLNFGGDEDSKDLKHFENDAIFNLDLNEKLGFKLNRIAQNIKTDLNLSS